MPGIIQCGGENFKHYDSSGCAPELSGKPDVYDAGIRLRDRSGMKAHCFGARCSRIGERPGPCFYIGGHRPLIVPDQALR